VPGVAKTFGVSVASVVTGRNTDFPIDNYDQINFFSLDCCFLSPRWPRKWARRVMRILAAHLMLVLTASFV
jgi:hypothetical protein